MPYFLVTGIREAAKEAGWSPGPEGPGRLWGPLVDSDSPGALSLVAEAALVSAPAKHLCGNFLWDYECQIKKMAEKGCNPAFFALEGRDKDMIHRYQIMLESRTWPILDMEVRMWFPTAYALSTDCSSLSGAWPVDMGRAEMWLRGRVSKEQHDDSAGPTCAQCGKVLPPKPLSHPKLGLGVYGDDVADATLICAHPKCREIMKDDLGFPTGETYSMWFCGERCADEHHRLNHEDEEIEIPEEEN